MNTFEYTCANCGAPAKKPALKAKKDWKSLEPAEFDTLGSWHCTGNCRGKVKVRRHKIEKREALAA